MSQKEKLVVIGNGMAGVNTVEHILKLAPNQFDITIFGSEPHPNYNRILLSYVLAGDSKVDDIVINSYEWYEEHGISLYTGETITEINTEGKTVTSDKGTSVSYDKLIISTGSDPFMLPLPGADKEGVIAYRTIQDCEYMMEAAKNYKKAVVIGGGLLGLEAARGFLNLGMKVDVVHICDAIMERQLDRTASKMLQDSLEEQGMNFLLSKQTEKILGKKRVTGLKFADGSKVDADLVVMAVGIRPNIQLAKDSGIEVNRGIVVNDYLETNVEDVFAVGECAEHRGIGYGLVAPLFEQGAVLAKKIADVDTAPYEGSVVYTKLKVSGVDVFSGGDFNDAKDTKAIKIEDEFSGIYKKVVVRDNKIVGAVLFGDTSDGNRLMQMIRNETDITGFEKSAILQEPGANAGGGSSVADMSDDEIICGCNGVSKGAICSAIKEQGLTSVEEVKNCTTASRSCGGCKPLVSDLLEYTLGDEFDKSAQKETMCECTDLEKDEIVVQIKEKGLSHVREVMSVLGWKNEEGCSKCRPAINYYLGMVHPEQYQDDSTSRFVNERMHANIQKDGTYSVVPRMYGGVTNPTDLKKIATVAEKYNVPKVKITGGQRIDLLGVKKEDLTNMWEELDMPSGYAYGKAVRTVKTCVGEEFCRFGTADSMGMGIQIEKRFERLNTPAKVKMAVSGCPRNCAESGIKDLGVVAIDGGWELYAGGNGGVKLRKGDLVATVKTEEEVIEYTEAYLQYYRETGVYGERTSEWVDRLGVQHIQDILLDEEKREELCARMDTALSVLKDPWKEAVESEKIQKDLYEVIEAK
ncbi:nitrite reductase large subunit NirB [Chengkuizengella axinellae]|uniref:Nitrite reductase large subunit NirB n=1 Tax=Chengkuizengella axinellae TaxID=3064388 RepID=A0ABT9J0D9_9BACL|nr:nitrite reductase large subunit NirB [Chengkuizengella sp. 2205SS18-9]MDP5275043.1 nitrite reductase large subunit NirB [Chengkuizengella sp. 2205SS18-9]